MEHKEVKINLSIGIMALDLTWPLGSANMSQNCL